MKMQIPSVSICIPIYNVEKYIGQCARSLFEQTLDDIEYIFVDDCSPDKSIEILEQVLREYPNRQSQVKIIRHKENKGISFTRTEAIDLATGEYVIHCDPDDWVELDMYQRLYEKAVQKNADMVYCSLRWEAGSDSHDAIFQYEPSPVETIKGFFTGKLHANLCGRLYKREIIKKSNFDYPDDICMCEDQRLNIQFLLQVNKIAYVEAPLYHYRANEASITAKGRNFENMQSEIRNIALYDKILPYSIYGVALNIYKRHILLEAIMYNSMSASQWHSLWKKAKLGVFTEKRFSLKMKLAFICAMINFPLANKIWMYLKNKHTV